MGFICLFVCFFHLFGLLASKYVWLVYFALIGVCVFFCFFSSESTFNYNLLLRFCDEFIYSFLRFVLQKERFIFYMMTYFSTRNVFRLICAYILQARNVMLGYYFFTESWRKCSYFNDFCLPTECVNQAHRGRWRTQVNSCHCGLRIGCSDPSWKVCSLFLSL